MNTNAISQSKFIAKNYNFNNHKILDIGAGAGTYIIEVAKTYEKVEGTAIDLPEMSKILKEIVQRNELSERIEVLSYDFNNKGCSEK